MKIYMFVVFVTQQLQRINKIAVHTHVAPSYRMRKEEDFSSEYDKSERNFEGRAMKE